MMMPVVDYFSFLFSLLWLGLRLFYELLCAGLAFHPLSFEAKICIRMQGDSSAYCETGLGGAQYLTLQV